MIIFNNQYIWYAITLHLTYGSVAWLVVVSLRQYSSLIRNLLVCQAIAKESVSQTSLNKQNLTTTLYCRSFVQLQLQVIKFEALWIQFLALAEYHAGLSTLHCKRWRYVDQFWKSLYAIVQLAFGECVYTWTIDIVSSELVITLTSIEWSKLCNFRDSM